MPVSVLGGVSLSLLFLQRLARVIWDKLSKVRGTYVPPPLSVLVTPTSIAGGYQDISDTLGRSFAFCSSDAHYTPTFLQLKSCAEAFPLPFHEVDCSPYNRPLHWLSSLLLSPGVPAHLLLQMMSIMTC